MSKTGIRRTQECLPLVLLLSFFKINNMKEIDEMLDRWIHNSIIRKQLRDLIIKELKQ